MTDKEIVELYWERSENAIFETSKKYGAYCYSISLNILSDTEDAEECVNDTYLHTWNSIPPTRPNRLMAFLGKIVRNISLDRLKRNKAEKRGGGTIISISEELDECVSGSNTVEDEIDYRIIIDCINQFLFSQPRLKADIFVRRYWYVDSIFDISKRFKMNENRVASILYKMRKELKEYFKKEGINV